MENVWSVFPLYGVVDGRCACGKDHKNERDIGKHIYFPGWADLQDHERVVGPDGCNYAVRTGQPSGIFVVDCDSDEATEAYLKLVGDHEAYVVTTGRGVHFYYLLPDFEVRNSQSKILPHVDVRGMNGWVVAEGSRHQNGKLYTHIGSTQQPLAAPQSLIDRLSKTPPPKDSSVPIAEPLEPADPERLDAAAKYLAEEADPGKPGSGGTELLLIAGKLVDGFRLRDDEAMRLLEEYYNPRMLPAGHEKPWTTEELQRKLSEARKGILPPALTARAPSPDWVPGSNKEKPAADVGAGRGEKANFGLIVDVLRAAPEWEGVFRFNVLTRQMVAINPPVPMRMQFGSFSDGDVGQIMCWFDQQGYKTSREDIRGAVEQICEMPESKFHPFIEYLDNLPVPDGTPTLDNLHELVLNSPDGPMASRIMKRQLVAAVRRSRCMPGLHDPMRPINHRLVVVLDGNQESGKSSFLRQLAGDQFYGSLKGDLKDKDTRLGLAGSVIVEMEEMVTARKADRNSLKAYISTEIDCDRAPYARSAEKVQRSYVLFGTSNQACFDDPTGGTRFAVIKVNKMCGKERMLELRDQIWSEANQLCLAGYSHNLDEEEKVFAMKSVENYEANDPLADDLETKLAGITFVTMKEAYQMVCGNKEPVMPQKEIHRFADALTRIGCKRYLTEVNGRAVRGWLVHMRLATLTPTQAVSSWLREPGAQAVRDKLAAKVQN